MGSHTGWLCFGSYDLTCPHMVVIGDDSVGYAPQQWTPCITMSGVGGTVTKLPDAKPLKLVGCFSPLAKR